MLTDEQGTESLECSRCSLTGLKLESVNTFSRDMNTGYIRAARNLLPDVESKIPFDRFHVVKKLEEIVDQIRQ